MAAYRQQHGALPAELTRSYPPVAAPLNNPPPLGVIAHGVGRFSNPDNAYEHVQFTTARGNLVGLRTGPHLSGGFFAAG
jgi:hypothetical protein